MLVGCGKLFSHGVQGRPGDDGGTVKMLQCNIPSFFPLIPQPSFSPSPPPPPPFLLFLYLPFSLSLSICHVTHKRIYVCINHILASIKSLFFQAKRDFVTEICT